MINNRLNYKIIILGESYVGKTSIVQRYINDIFDDDLLATIGIDLMRKTIQLNDDQVDLDIWDTAGQERFYSITKSYYRNAHGILLVFDLSDEKTFTCIDQWLEGIKLEVSENVPIFLIGNKLDRIDNLNLELYQNRANRDNLTFFAVSAKSGQKIDEVFYKMAEECKKYVRPQDYDVESIIFDERERKKRKKRCC